METRRFLSHTSLIDLLTPFALATLFFPYGFAIPMAYAGQAAPAQYGPHRAPILSGSVYLYMEAANPRD